MLNDFDDIPVAVREEQTSLRSPGKPRRWVMLGGGLAAAIGLGLGGAAAFFKASSPLASMEVGRAAEEWAAVLADQNPLKGDRPGRPGESAAQEPFVASNQNPSDGRPDRPLGDWDEAGLDSNLDSNLDSSGQMNTVGAGAAIASARETAQPDSEAILGHYPYAEAATTQLISLADGSGIMLTPAAAQAFRTMQQAAQQEGIRLVSLSGFRSVETQRELFFGVKAARGQTASERAKVSAPPGHSEHHTGYAIDIGDGSNRATDLSESFETTAAFQWLQTHAPYYSFELSFPRDNDQGVSYEPWHWRYVGDQASLELFHKGR